MRKPLTIIATVLALGLALYVASRVVLSEGPCAPKQPAPLGSP